MPIYTDNPLELPIFQFESLKNISGLAHAVSTRYAPKRPMLPEVQPATPGDYRLAGRSIYIQREIITGRRSELLTALGLDYREVQPNLVGVHQMHTANVRSIGKEAYGANLNWDNPIPECDGIITDCPGVPLMTIHADCPAILLYDPVRKVAGTLHSGWRGTVGKIGLEGVRQMVTNFGSNPKDILAGIGPSIGPCCYQVGEPVLSEVQRAFGPELSAELLQKQPDDSFHFDLWQAIYQTLLEAGLAPDNIEQSQVCTLCQRDHFFSYRATPQDQRHNYGQFMALVMLT
jgi:YfiH family protein